jgi:hypothetical protein
MGTRALGAKPVAGARHNPIVGSLLVATLKPRFSLWRCFEQKLQAVECSAVPNRTVCSADLSTTLKALNHRTQTPG